MGSLKYSKPERLWLRDHPELGERWLQDRISEDPALLGLGDLDSGGERSFIRHIL